MEEQENLFVPSIISQISESDFDWTRFADTIISKGVLCKYMDSHLQGVLSILDCQRALVKSLQRLRRRARRLAGELNKMRSDLRIYRAQRKHS